MRTSNDIHELATKTGLRFDLESAFNAGKTNGMILMGTWLKMLDIENYNSLKDICKTTDGSYSLNSLGEAIVKNKVIRLK
jgi:hypothetical protein